MQVAAQVDVEPGREFSDGKFSRARDVGSSRYVIVIIDIGEREPRLLLRNSRKAPEQAGQPETDAAFVGE